MANINHNLEEANTQNGELFRWFCEHPGVHVTWIDIFRMIGTNKASTRIGEIISQTGLPINRDNTVQVINRRGKSVTVSDYFLPVADYNKWKANNNIH